MIGEKPAEKMEFGGNMCSKLQVVHISKSPDDANFPSSESEVEL
jgi:hypothetical protein